MLSHFLSSPTTSIIVVLAVFGVLAGFFRHLLGKVLVLLLVQIALFVLFPQLLIYFVKLITTIRGSLA